MRIMFDHEVIWWAAREEDKFDARLSETDIIESTYSLSR